MEFDAALDTVKKYLHISLDNEYDGIIVKKMAKSNLIGEENSTGNQTHIAITGAQRDAFPYICAAQYLTCPHEDIDDTIKRFFMCQVKVNIYRSNVEPLDKSNTIRFGAGQEKKSVYTTVWRRRGRNNEEQVQLSALNLDDSDFVEFRKLIHTNDYIVILKLQACLEYDWFIIPKESIAISDDLKALDGKFIHKSTSTVVKIDQNVHMDALLHNETTKGIIPSSNILLYGVPGCGKSHKVEEEYESKITTEKNKIRVVFHPDYTYSDFVGQLLPVLKEVENAQGVKEEKLQYEFVPGPFTKIIKTAYEEPNQQCLLIIEELNRGNAPAIFGEIFQLLDRNDNGESKYGIYNADIAKYAYGGLPENQGIAINVIANTPIKLPPNLTIVATMNTSDQNVFTMDTAFQRRWEMKHIPNKFDKDDQTTAHSNKKLPNSEISWGAFAQTVNKKMHTANLGFGGTEDKSLGVYFATDNDLDDAERFAEKVLKYLWDDAFKLGRKELFNDCSQGLSAVIEAYEDAAKAKIEKQSAEDPLKKVLVPEVYNEMQKKMAEMVAEQAQTAEEKTSEEEAAKSAAEDNPAQKPAGEE